jgi:hypothetical protein
MKSIKLKMREVCPPEVGKLLAQNEVGVNKLIFQLAVSV